MLQNAADRNYAPCDSGRWNLQAIRGDREPTRVDRRQSELLAEAELNDRRE